MFEAIGEIAADNATMSSMVSRLDSIDPVEVVLGIVSPAQEDAARVRRELQDVLGDWMDSIHALGQVQHKMATGLGSLQEVAGALRQAPVSEILDPLRDFGRELAQRQGKLVQLDLEGAELQLDRKAVQALMAAVRQLVRFAVTHGIEDVKGRSAADKPTTGRVSVQVSVSEDQAQVVIEDDGQGLAPEMITTCMRELGWSDDVAATNPDDFILRSGLDEIEIDARNGSVNSATLRTDLRGLNGWLNVSSQSGKGTRFELRLPPDLPLVDGMVVRVGEVRYVVPLKTIRKIVSPEPANLVRSSADGGHNMLRFEGELVPIRTLGQSSRGRDETPEQAFRCKLLVIVDGENGSAALPIDELLGRQQVLVRPLRGHLTDARGASGCAIFGEGEVGIVLGHI
jgi:two-component system, chemotaxis family, sensor kinase CheA